MLYHRLLVLLGTAALTLAPLTASAALIYSIEVADLQIAPNGAGQINVSVTGTGDLLNLAGYEFRIAPVMGTTSQLRFTEEIEGFLSAADYLFVGNSAAQDDAIPSTVGTVSTMTLPSDTFVGGDSTSDFTDIAINGTKLLVRLNVAHDTGPADPATTFGHSFSLSLVPASGDSTAFASGGSNTGFVDGSFGTVAFDSTSGTVTVAIPEPSVLVLVVTGCTSLAYVLLRKAAALSVCQHAA